MSQSITRHVSLVRRSLKVWIFRLRDRVLKHRRGRHPGHRRRAIQLEFHWNSKF